jgi:hypothetical protein
MSSRPRPNRDESADAPCGGFHQYSLEELRLQAKSFNVPGWQDASRAHLCSEFERIVPILDNFPLDLWERILRNLSVQDVVSYCSTSKVRHEWCRYVYWPVRLYVDFGLLLGKDYPNRADAYATYQHKHKERKMMMKEGAEYTTQLQRILTNAGLPPLETLEKIMMHPYTDVNVASRGRITRGDTGLMWLVIEYNSKIRAASVVEGVLRQHPELNVNQTDARGTTALHRVSNPRMARAIIAHPTFDRATLDLRDEDGMTPLEYALQPGQGDMAEVIAILREAAA